MSRLTLVLAILGVLLAACSSAAPPASPDPSQLPASPSASPSAPSVPASPSPTDSPAPATPAPVVTPDPTGSPAPVKLTAKERYLRDGIRRDATDCRPVRDDLPVNAVAGIECRSTDEAVARMGFYLFASDEDMLDAYFARMDAEGLELDSGACTDGEGEAPYIPGEDELAYRHACFVNDEGYGNYRATVPGRVYIGLLGRTADMRVLEDAAWRGNQDVPGFPTLWAEPEA